MNKQKSTPDPRRLSGPELSELLDRVVVEHGENVSISEVNRVRLGGVAGFFCREEFEVVIDDGDVEAGDDRKNRSDLDLTDGEPKEPTGDGSGQLNQADSDETSLRRQILEAAEAAIEAQSTSDLDDAASETVFAGPVRPGGSQPGGQPGRVRPDEARPERVPADGVLLDGLPADGVQIDGVRGRSLTNGPPELGTSIAAAKVDRDDQVSDRFLARLEHRLAESSAIEIEHRPQPRRTASARTDHSQPARTDHSRPVRTNRSQPTTAEQPRPVAPAPIAPVPPPELVGGIGEVPVGQSGRVRIQDTASQSGFWWSLAQARDELAGFLPLDSPLVAVVGPMPLAVAVVRRLRAAVAMAPAEVHVLTSRAGIFSEPTWNVVRSSGRLVEIARARNRGDDPGPMVIIVDVPVDLPPWVRELQHRLRAEGVGLFRYAVPGQPTGEELERYRQGIDVPYAIDLASRVEPARIAELLADRHPIASVGGADLTPELLLALRVGHAVAPRGATSDSKVNDG